MLAFFLCSHTNNYHHKYGQYFSHLFSLIGKSKGSRRLHCHRDLNPHIKKGGLLLSHIALQYHRRRRA